MIPYKDMTPAQRTKARIAANLEIDARVERTRAAEQILEKARSEKKIRQAVRKLDNALVACDGYGLPDHILAMVNLRRK